MPEKSKFEKPRAVEDPPGKGRRVVLACPTYGPVESAAAKSLRAAVMHSASQGVVWTGDASPDREGFAAARNNAVESVINDEAVDGILWSDSDILWPVDGISRLILRGPEFICGIYYQRGGEHWPLIAHYNEKADSMNWWIRWPENAVAPIDGCGFGCVYTSIEIFRKIDPPWFEFKKFSEDFTFCRKAAQAGYQLYVDTSVICGHLADPVAIGHSDFKRKHPKFFVDDKEGKLKSAS